MESTAEPTSNRMTNGVRSAVYYVCLTLQHYYDNVRTAERRSHCRSRCHVAMIDSDGVATISVWSTAGLGVRSSYGHAVSIIMLIADISVKHRGRQHRRHHSLHHSCRLLIREVRSGHYACHSDEVYFHCNGWLPGRPWWGLGAQRLERKLVEQPSEAQSASTAGGEREVVAHIQRPRWLATTDLPPCDSAISTTKPAALCVGEHTVATRQAGD